MNQQTPNPTPPPLMVTESLDSTFVDAEGVEDTTVRPARFKIPRPWPEGVPLPKPPAQPQKPAGDAP